MTRHAPDPGEFARLAVSAAQVARRSDPAEVRAIANRPLDVTNGDHNAAVAERLRILRADQEAREILAVERMVAVEPPPVLALGGFLAINDEEIAYRVDQLWPLDARVLLAAAFKAGKSTMVGNIIRSLVDGDPFLGEFEVARVERVVLVDVELGDRRLRHWLRDQDIQSQDRVSVVSLRGRGSTFDILTGPGRRRWAEHIGPADVLILDPLRPVLDTFGLDENREAGKFLSAFDEFLEEAGIPEAVVVHHMGHGPERSRGDSRLRDWPDAEWKIVRESEGGAGRVTDDPAARRYFSAYGRDVDVPEGQLEYDPLMRTLSFAGGSRRDHKLDDLAAEVADLVRREPGCSKDYIEKTLKHNVGDVRSAVAKADKDGLIEMRHQGNRHAHFPRTVQPRPGRPSSSGRMDDYSSTRPYRDEESVTRSPRRTSSTQKSTTISRSGLARSASRRTRPNLNEDAVPAAPHGRT